MVIYEEILREFSQQEVRYILVGGLAFNLLGGLRTTSDLDILVEMSDVNLAKVVKILRRKGYGVKLPVDPMKIAHQATREDWIKNKHMKAFNFYKDGGLQEVDIIIDSPVTYEQARASAVTVKVGKLKLPVISIDNLIKMKRKADRGIDRMDIQDLKLIKKIRKSK